MSQDCAVLCRRADGGPGRRRHLHAGLCVPDALPGTDPGPGRHVRRPQPHIPLRWAAACHVSLHHYINQGVSKGTPDMLLWLTTSQSYKTELSGQKGQRGQTSTSHVAPSHCRCGVHNLHGMPGASAAATALHSRRLITCHAFLTGDGCAEHLSPCMLQTSVSKCTSECAALPPWSMR